ncbi:tryptophan 7-halogenase [Exilibacterium tricleocarpae]|uniref:Tryptophan 7-halogenase n=1 Tax=Exilibacterium tricleocarpae TaxID=2591008 RepID=A0A545SQU9_9GAMM|nr:tryptophan halogenase family protein [Exilibacterium tricleocarpae]TQV67339.1 tryptophan 7-halogenase [Exilibacterium tricleocarpae]
MHPKQRIVILGGGTAGWMAANLMATKWAHLDFDITLIEAPDIGIIGVGEGSTPPLKGFMDTIGAQESEWMADCNATYKVGISFKNWSTKPGFSRYFHPFLAQPDEFTAPAFFHNSFLRRKGIDLEGHPDHFFLASHLAEHKLAPVVPEHFPFEINYGYHFDSALLGKFLGRKAATKGVKYRQAKVVDVALDEQGNIAGLHTEQGETIRADLYVDCTGFRAQLIQQALKVPFRSYAENLFNDAAVVLQTEQRPEIACQTVSTALKYGWAWAIPLTSRIGNGYVYSSSFCDADHAETELRAHLGLLEADVQARHLKMKVGRVEQHWAKNCLAVGLSQGFVEPLEATALDMVQETVARFIEAFEKGGFTDTHRDDYNRRISSRFEAVRDYIVCHYRVNSRTDTDYWLENARNEKVSASLRSILHAWVSGQNITDELQRQKLDIYFPNVSWNCLLAGYGIYPTQAQLKPGNALANKYKTADIHEFIRRCALNFKPHREQLSA